MSTPGELENKLLAAWGVTREEVAAIDAHGGYAWAKRMADAQRKLLETHYTEAMKSLAGRAGIDIEITSVLEES